MTSVLLLVLFLAQQAPPEKSTLSGTVVDSVTSLPLGKVEVVAEHLGGHDPGASTATDAKGKFLIVGVEPGTYRLLAQRNGYLDQYYGAKRSSGNGSTITLAAGQSIDNLQIRITPVGVIAGTVRDSDGEPLIGAEVYVQGLTYMKGQRGIDNYERVNTDDLGQYRVTNLPPGRYFVSVVAYDRYLARVDHTAKSADQPEVPITTFYPGTADPSAAKPIVLAAGQRVTGADISIIRSRLYKVAVHIDAPSGLQSNARLHYSSEILAADENVGKSQRLNNSGDVEITSVPPGTYRLQFGASEPEKPFNGVIDLNGGRGCSSSVPLSVGNADVENIRVVAGGCGEIGGSVRDENGKPPAKIQDFQSVLFRSSTQAEALLKADGTFRNSLPPGHYIVDLPDITSTLSLYVKSIRAGTHDVLREGITLEGSERVDLEIILGSEGGKVEGAVSDKDDKMVLGATVVLIPDDPALRSRLDFTRDAVTDQSGHFEMKNVAPGEYRLFAWDDIEKDSWFDPDVLRDYEARGVPVTIKVKDSQTVDLHVIP